MVKGASELCRDGDGGTAGGTASRAGRIRSNFAAFDARVRHAERLAAAGDRAGAAVETAIAATLAAHRHCGVFASPRLERLMTGIGRTLDGGGDARHGAGADGAPYRRVLHVCTQLAPVGGLTKMLAL